jgi:tetratricopeptide (TPR) repeat protein
MAENSRIDDLRRRVQKDPASIAFAQLAEECRRLGVYQESIDICRAGLEIHPGYLSARVTLGRALIELGQLDEAHAELSRVLESAPENLAAIRGLAEIHHRRGDLVQALAQYRAALLLARNDPDLEETIADLSRQIEPPKPAPSDGLTLQHMQDALLKHAPPPPKAATAAQVAPPPPKAATAAQVASPPPKAAAAAQVASPPAKAATAAQVPSPPKPDHGTRVQAENPVKTGFPEIDRGVRLQADSPANHRRQGYGGQEAGSQQPAPELLRAAAAPTPISADSAASGPPTAEFDDRATRTVVALEQWLTAIHVSRQQRHA